MAVAKRMITEVFSFGPLSDQVYVFYPCQVFSTSVPALVTTSFATIYLMSMAAGKFQLERHTLQTFQNNNNNNSRHFAGNLAGRIGWAAVSDQVGRRNTYLIFTTAGEQLGCIWQKQELSINE